MFVNQPIRIRDKNGQVPLLTPAQRAKITTVDLDNPPSFVKLIRNQGDFHEIAHKKTPGTSVWIQRPDWGAAESIFDRRETGGCHNPNEDAGDFGRGLLTFSHGKRCTSRVERLSRIDIVNGLRSAHSKPFLDNVTVICRQVIAETGYKTLDAAIAFKAFSDRPKDRDLHSDNLPGFRGFAATEHGNVIFADARQARAAGFRFMHDDPTIGGNANPHVVDLIEAGVALYTPPLRTLSWFRGAGLSRLGPTAWHAAHEIAAGKPYARPCLIIDVAP